MLIVPGVSCRLGGADVCDAITGAHHRIGRHGRFGGMRRNSTAIILTQPIRVSGQSVGTSGIQLGGCYGHLCICAKRRATESRTRSHGNRQVVKSTLLLLSEVGFARGGSRDRDLETVHFSLIHTRVVALICHCHRGLSLCSALSA